MKLFGAGRPEHPMADRKEARRILDGLPAQELKALEELAHWHESVSAAEGFRAEERAQLLAMLDEAAQPRVTKLSRQYFAAPPPSRYQENLLWTRLHEYWRQAGHAHARCVDAILQGGKGAEAKALAGAVVRALRALAQQIKWQQLRYGPIEAAAWGVINRVYAVAEARGIADARVEFLKAAMLSASSTDSLLAPELELAERLIGELAGGFALSKSPAPELPYWTDLGQAMAPLRVARPPQPSAGLRFFGPGETINRLASELKLDAGYDPELVLGVARHLALYWAPEPPERKHPRHSVKSRLAIAHGFDGVLEALGGEADSLAFDKRAAESWIVENVSAGGFGALAPQAKIDWLKVGTLVAVQPDGGTNWVIGTVRRVSKVSNQATRVGIQTLSRSPSLSRFARRGAGEAQGVLLPAPAPGSGEAAIALRAGVWLPGENLEAEIGGRQHVYMPQGVAERGDDYEIVRFREMIRES